MQVLPVSEHRAEIVRRLRESRALVVCGGTGSGKTTQLPKMVLEALGGAARVACTQPRRIAAVAAATRVAAELGEAVGGTVGWQHRFGKCVSENTRVKFMTDGVLLAETRSDPLLRAYDAVIIDEAHERSLNIDFLLGICKRLLAKRGDLRVVVSSATLDGGRFSEFFGGAPLIDVPGRLYPVETLYMPPEDPDEADLARETVRAVSMLPAAGDILVFLPGEREIREAGEALSAAFPGDAVLPLMASLPPGDIERVFKPAPARKIVLATNVAETSLTIPGIKAVVDGGLARVPRYNYRTRVQRLQIERISQASAKQRAGRCGRTAPGTCVRLYSEEDFAAMQEWTAPEIQRSSLAGVLLSMLDLGLGAIEGFPFLDPPRPGVVRNGWRELLELGAIRRAGDRVDLTATGRRLARMPLEPRLGKMLLSASSLATLPSALPVVAAMGCDDPRRRPPDEKDKAAAAHARFRVPGSDFLGTLELWRWWDEQCRSLSQSKLRALAKKNYLSFQKMREWRAVARQLEEVCARMDLDTRADNGGSDALHMALMTGLASQIGRYDDEEGLYRGAHGMRFSVHPGSVLAKAKKKSEWIVAGELVETSRLFARNVAAIDPRWIEKAVGSACRYSWHDPQWDAQNGFVRALERVTLYGLVVADGRRRDYSRIDPTASRSLFLLHALVLGEYPRRPPEVAANLETIARMRERAERRRNISLFDTDALVAHFDAAVPPGICSTGAFGKWLRGATDAEKAAFALDPAKWLPRDDSADADFPDRIVAGKAVFRLEYRNTPGEPERDGITCIVRREDAAALVLWRADWLVPGFLREKIAALLAALPASLRRAIGEPAEAAAILEPLLRRENGSLCDEMRRAVSARFGIRIPAGALENARLPPHLRVRYKCVDPRAGGRVVFDTRDLAEALSAAGVAPSASSAALDGRIFTSWDFGDAALSGRAAAGVGHAALHDEGSGVSVRMFRDAKSAAAAHRDGVARLLYIAAGEKLARRAAAALRALDPGTAFFFKSSGCTAEQAARDVAFATLREAADPHAPPESKRDFEALLPAAAREARLDETMAAFVEALRLAAANERAAAKLPGDIAESIAVQTAWMFFPRCLKNTPPGTVRLYPRWMNAQADRIARASFNHAGDRTKSARFAPYWEQYVAAATGKGPRVRDRAALAEYRNALEEYRIALFAPGTKTLYKTSPERLALLFETKVAAGI